MVLCNKSFAINDVRNLRRLGHWRRETVLNLKDGMCSDEDCLRTNRIIKPEQWVRFCTSYSMYIFMTKKKKKINFIGKVYSVSFIQMYMYICLSF